nr:coiled-coil domain-containing protein 138 [Ciona intestinalis]|eukprot:XP_026693422.1 coiled-coil domain-containing protein 138 [Ciona intestinalis]
MSNSTSVEEPLSSGSQTDSEYDPYVEHLRRKYLHSVTSTEPSTLNSNFTTTDDSPADFVDCSPSSSLTLSERLHYNQAMDDLRLLLSKGPKHEESLTESKKTEVTDGTSVKHTDLSLDHTLTNSTTLPTLPSDITTTTFGNNKSQKSVRISLEPTTLQEYSHTIDGVWPGPSILRSGKAPRSTDVKVIHNELMNIHRKLNEKSQQLTEDKMLLDEREQELLLREESVRMREDVLEEEEASVRRDQEVMMRLQGVESEVQEKFEILREHHTDEMNRVSQALADKLKDLKRLKSSFDVIKNQNDEMKQQILDLTDQTQKLQTQQCKVKEKMLKTCNVKMNLNDDFIQVLSEQQNRKLDDKPVAQPTKSVEKNPKVWGNCFEALSVTLEWVCSAHLKPLANKSESGVAVLHRSREYIGDNCLKVLPLLVEVIRYLPLFTSQVKHHLPYIRFIYWSLHHLEDTHHALLSSTARRLGEELVRSSPTKPTTDISSSMINTTLQHSLTTTEVKPQKQNSFFRSTNTEVRMLSCFVILKTLHQVDMLAQVFDQLKRDLKDERGRETFLEYSATQAVLPFMTYKTNKALLGSAVDVMLQMAMESPLLASYLDLCSCESWFRAVTSSVRSPTTDNSTLEKLSIILQKLSKIKGNRKLFETFSLGRILQEKYRECDPDNSFLSLNLRSILFNLNLLKTSTTT